MFLRAVHFIPGVSVVLGGKYAAITFWDLDKYPDILVEKQDNGDFHFITAHDGRVRKVRASAIAWTLEEPPGTEAQKTEPALKKRAEAEKLYAAKFRGGGAIKGTEQKR